MRHLRTRQTRGFTLIEILVVVIILGILATIIIGLFGNSSRDAKLTSLKDNLRTIRSSLQIYLAHHGAFPAQGSFEAQMTQYTDATGATSGTKTATHIFGPYLANLPPLPIGNERGKSGVTTTTFTSGFGWGYDATLGTFRANCADSELDPDGVQLNAY